MWLLLLMILVMPYEMSPYLAISDSFLGVIQDFTFIKLLGMLGFAWVGVKLMTGAAAENVFGSAQARIFLLFVGGVLVAGALSGSGFVAISRYLMFLLFMPFVLVTVRTHDDLRKVVYAAALTYAIVFPYALRQMYRYSTRLGVGLYETNYFAADVLLVIPLAFAIARQHSDRSRRRLFVAAGIVLVLSLFLTASRGGFLGLIVAGVVFAYRRKGAVGALVLLLVLSLAVIVLPTGIGERALATFKGASQSAGLEESNRAHVALFWAGIRMIAAAPLTGVGPLNFKTLSQEYAEDLQQPYIAHNMYLEIGAELGLPVLAIFLALLWRTFRALARAARLAGSPEKRELAVWADGLRTGLVGFLVAGAFISAQYEKMFWVIVFLSIVIERLARRLEVAPAAEPVLEGMIPSGSVVEPLR